MNWRSWSLLSLLRKYDKVSFHADLKAALVVSLFAIPQTIGYALLAGLPPMVGLITGIFASMTAACFNSSSYLVVGPTSAVALLMQSSISEILNNFYRGASPDSQVVLSIAIAMQMTFLVGFFQILAGVFNLGRLAQFVSRSVMSGYMVGIALLIIINQMANYLGVARPPGNFSPLDKVWLLFSSIQRLHWPSLGVAAATTLLLIVLRRYRTLSPIVTIVVISAGVWLGNLSPEGVPLVSLDVDTYVYNKVGIVRDMGWERSSLIFFSHPFLDWKLWDYLIPSSFAIALLGILESTTVSKTISIKSGEDVVLNQDVLGLGIANFVASFFGAMPSSGSVSRSFACFNFGGKTKLVCIFSGIGLALFVGLCGPVIQWIPMPCIAAILLMTCRKLVDVKQVKRCFNTTQSDAVVLVLTVIGMLLFSIDTAFYIGIGLSIILYLRSSMHPNIVEYAFDKERGMVVPSEEFPQHPQVRLICLEGEFYFAGADFFQDVLKRLAGNNKKVRVIVLHLQQAYHLDATACFVLKELHYTLQNKGIDLILSGIHDSSWRAFKRFGLLKKIGKDRCFRWKPSSSYRALEQAYERGIEISLGIAPTLQDHTLEDLDLES